MAHDSLNRVLQYLTETEELAEEILTEKQEIVELSRKHNKNREGLRSLQHAMSSEDYSSKTWVCFGSMFIKLPNTSTKKIIEEDQKTLDKEINKLRTGLKTKVNKLRTLEGKPEMRGMGLKALTKEEIQAIESVLQK